MMTIVNFNKKLAMRLQKTQSADPPSHFFVHFLSLKCEGGPKM